MSLRERLTESIKAEGQPAGTGSALAVIQGHVHQQVVHHLTGAGQASGDETGDETGDDALRKAVTDFAAGLVDREYPQLNPAERSRVVAGVCDDVFAFGPITPLLQDPSVNEVMVNGPDRIYAEKGGQVVATPYRFRDARHVMMVIERVLAPLGRRVDESSPMVDARLPDGSRVNVILPPICLNGPTITIRKFRDTGLDLEGLIGLGSLTREMAEFLQSCVRARLNIVVSGGTASGKTTMLNTLSNEIPADERMITIEDAAELRLRQGHVLSLEARPANAEGSGAVAIRDLLRNALRMRPDRLIIGEVRGGEALDLLQAMNTGHDGCLSTLHANKPRDALSRLETMALMSNLELPVRVIREQIAAAVDLIVHQERSEDGSRRVAQITEVQGMEGDVITMQDVFVFERTGVTAEGKVQGRFQRSPVRPAVADVFRRFGLPSQWTTDPGTGRSP